MIDFEVSFKKSNQYITRTEDCNLKALQGNLRIFVENIDINEPGNFYNNLSYMGLKPPHENYYFTDNYIAYINNKKSLNQNDLKIPLSYTMTKEINVYLHDLKFSSDKAFFGEDCKTAEKNWIASMFHPFSTNREESSTINLRTGLFLNNTNSYQLFKIVDHKNNLIKFEYRKNVNTVLTLLITCDCNWEELGDFYFDLLVASVARL